MPASPAAAFGKLVSGTLHMRGHLARLRCLSVGRGEMANTKWPKQLRVHAALPLPMMDFCVSEVALLEVEDEVVADHVPVVVAFWITKWVLRSYRGVTVSRWWGDSFQAPTPVVYCLCRRTRRRRSLFGSAHTGPFSTGMTWKNPLIMMPRIQSGPVG